MPAKAPPIGPQAEKLLKELGEHIKAHRKRLGISASATSEAAGMSRPTLYRIEQGESSVSIGSYMAVMVALGLKINVLSKVHANAKSKLPTKIKMANYPQLKRLAWQVKGAKELNPKEVLSLYERNWKHVDVDNMQADELELINLLLEYFGRERLLV